MGRFSREELVAAHDHFVEVAARCTAGHEWREWADLFTEDAEYLEHTYGRFSGRDQIYEWIQPLMNQWPNSEMTDSRTTGACSTRNAVGGSARSRIDSGTPATAVSIKPTT